MAVFVPVENTVQVKFIQSMDGQVITNNIYFHKDAAWTDAEMATFAEAAYNEWVTNMLPNQAVNLSLNQVDVIDLTTQTSGGGTFTSSTSGTSAVGVPQPPFSAFCLKLVTAKRGRSYHGRVYIAGLDNGKTASDGKVNGAYATALQGGLNSIKTALESAITSTMVVVSRYSGVTTDHKPIPRTTGIYTPVTDITYTDLNLDVQRRRAVGRGV